MDEKHGPDIWEIVKGAGGVAGITSIVLGYLGIRQKTRLEAEQAKSQASGDQFTKVNQELWKIIEELKADVKKAEEDATEKIRKIESTLEVQNTALLKENTKLKSINFRQSEEILTLRRHLRILSRSISSRRQEIPNIEIAAIIQEYNVEEEET